MLSLRVATERWPLAVPLRDSSGTLTDLDVVVVTLSQSGRTGRGEAAGVHYLADDVQHMVAQIEAARPAIEADANRRTLLDILPRGGARNAVDCAMWELEAQRTGCAAWQLADISAPRPLLTTITLSAETPHEMAARASAAADTRALKLKLTGESIDVERVRAVRGARPDVWLCVDANQGFTRHSLETSLPVLVEAGVALIEQPLPVGQENELAGLHSPIPIAADESVQDSADLERLIGHFDYINIKLDKCGGLTEGLAMAHQARRLGFEIMVGNMTGTTLAMAPAFILGQLCKVVDLDGPTFLRDDRAERVRYEAGRIWCPEAAWGGLSTTSR